VAQYPRAVLVGLMAALAFASSACGGGDPEEGFAQDTSGIDWEADEGGTSLLDLGYSTCQMLDEGSTIIDIDSLWNQTGLTMDYSSRVLIKASIDHLCPEYDNRVSYDLLDDRE
jgi:hypothetical protein